MLAGIITIGDEILIGQIVDTNSAWLSEVLNDGGITVGEKLSVADDPRAIGKAVGDAMARFDVTVVTGGLGPTKDDITKRTLADLFGCGLVRDDATYEWIREMTARRGFRFNELNRDQALVPACCTPLRNVNGTAPGMWFERDGRVLVSLPGVPFEMKAIMEREVMPRLGERFDLRSIVHGTAVLFGIGESDLALRLEAWEGALPAWLKLAYLPGIGVMRLRLSAYDVERGDAIGEIERRYAELEAIVPEYIIGYGDVTPASATAAMLRERSLTLAVAESCTGGALSAAFTAIPGVSEYFLGGVVSYADRVKTDVLGVDMDDIKAFGAVSDRVAGQMAVGVKRVCGSDYAIAATGVAGPGGGTAVNPVGTVWIAVATPEGVFSRRFSLGELRGENIARTVSHGINMLRLELLGYKNIELVQGTL